MDSAKYGQGAFLTGLRDVSATCVAGANMRVEGVASTATHVHQYPRKSTSDQKKKCKQNQSLEIIIKGV